MNSRDDVGIREVFFVVIIAFSISFSIYITIISNLVDPYIEGTNRLPHILDFYETEENAINKIYFIGSSQIREGVDANLIENHMIYNNYTIQAFNLGFTADTPLRRITELNLLIRSKPKLVIIGLSYTGISNRTKIHEDHLALVADRVDLDDELIKLFNENEKKLLKFNFLDLSFYKRKFLFHGLKYSILNKKPNHYIFDFKAPARYTKNITYEKLIYELNKTPDYGLAMNVFEEDNNQKKALSYTINKLKNNNIKIILINMPLNPIIHKKVSNSTRKNYISYIKSTGVAYYDFEMKYPSTHFIDFTHLNAEGRAKFSSDLAKIVYEEVRRDGSQSN